MANLRTISGQLGHETKLTLKQATIITGGLSETEKLPGFSISLTPSACKRGAILSEVEGSVCSYCYGKKFLYLWKAARNALDRRLQALDHPLWVQAMSLLINHYKNSKRKDGRFFRWLDVGDLNSVRHLSNIAEVCHKTDGVSHWLSSRESEIIAEFLTHNNKPKNLTIRISADMLNQKPETTLGLPYATVSTDKPLHNSFRCPAGRGHNQCGKCRACWNPKIMCIDYKKH